MGCASTSVAADSGVAVIRHLGFGIVAVAVHQQNGPMSIGTPRPCCLEWGMKQGWESQPAFSAPPALPPPSIPQCSCGLPPLPSYLIQQRPAHRTAPAGVGIQRDLCRETGMLAGTVVPTGTTVWGGPRPLPTYPRR